MTTHWWQRVPERVLEEDAQLRDLLLREIITRYEWQRQTDGQLWLTANLLLGTRTQAVELRFPERYPGECPAMRPVPYGLRLSEHQFGGEGVLCLELGPDNWHSRYTAADLLVSAWKLLALEIINTAQVIPIQSRHVETLGMEIRRNSFRLMVSQSALDLLRADGRVKEFQYTGLLESNVAVFWVTDAPSGEPLDGVPPIIKERKKYVGLAIGLSDDAGNPPANVAAFCAYLEQSGLSAESAVAAQGLVLLLQSTRVSAYYIFESDESVQTVSVMVDRSTQGPDRRPAVVTALKGAVRVAIVGLGSLGSKVAASLARTGITNFVLVDGDVFLPENIVRHEADYRLAGLMKVEAVSARIRSISASPVIISTFPHDVVDGSNPAIHSKTVNAIAEADVIIDTTANPEAFNFLADLASEERRRFAWGEVFAGGLGGYVAYAAPQQTPCPSCVRDAFHAHASDWPPAPQGAAGPYAALRVEGPPIIATDSDVTVIASALAALSVRLATNDLIDCAPLSFIGLRRGWIFDHAFDTRTVRVRSDDFSCPRCWSRPTSPEVSMQATVEQLLGSMNSVKNTNLG